ncbi:MAG: malonate transporter [Rhodocyclaceae bacterium]|nr:malonate transporter [Rhodocyclaceae bacterium]
MTDFLALLDFSLGVTGPIFVLLGLGVVLRRIGVITDAFIDGGSRLVFAIGLPTMLFVSIARTPIADSAGIGMLVYGVAATVAIWLLMEWLASVLVQPARDRGVVVQGAFRSNFGVVGLAYCANAYGEAGLAMAALYVGVLTILVNILGVITLSRSLHRSQGAGRVLRGIATNPLIIGILLALPVSAFAIPLPAVAMKSAGYIADMTLPLALLCTGATLDFRSLRAEAGNAALASVGKLVAMPLLFTLGAWAAGFRAMELGVLMLMASAPSAAASYSMVRAMGGNATLAANIIALTTLGSLLTTSAGVSLLRGFGLM